MDKLLEQAVRRLAGNRCEYCHVPESPVKLKHVFDHIIARQHGGRTALENLALCCGRCNQFKGPNISGIDPNTGDISRLFNPRRDRWRDHFPSIRLILPTHVRNLLFMPRQQRQLPGGMVFHVINRGVATLADSPSSGRATGSNSSMNRRPTWNWTRSGQA